MPERIAKAIFEVATQEHLDLRKHGCDVFFLPELAFAYSVAKHLLSDSPRLLGTTSVTCRLEDTTLLHGQRVDLVIEIPNRRYAVEFKIAGYDVSSYSDDIKKLARITNDYDRIFCALMNERRTTIDPNDRTQAVEQRSGVPVERVVNPFDFFSSNENHFEPDQTLCVIGIWKINSDFQSDAID